jgi:hypothetical protein
MFIIASGGPLARGAFLKNRPPGPPEKLLFIFSFIRVHHAKKIIAITDRF